MSQLRKWVNEIDADWAAIELARRVRDEFHFARKFGEKPSSKDVEELIEDTVRTFKDVSAFLYEKALEQARNRVGRLALDRMLAARCILTGKRPREYAPIYQNFRNDIASAVESALHRQHDYSLEIARSLTDRDGLDFAVRWLEAIAETGDPEKAAHALREEMARWVRFKDEPVRGLANLGIIVAGASATAYLDGLRSAMDGSVLILVDSYVSPFPWYGSGMKEIQWEVFPSAPCRLRAYRNGEEEYEALVASVPELWVEAMRDSDGRLREDLLVLIKGDECWFWADTEICDAVATVISNRCHAEILSMGSSMPASMPARVRTSERRIASEAAQAVLRSKFPYRY